MVSPVAASGFDVHRLEEIDSTNDWLLAAARDGAPDRTVVVADFQRRGRGRLDRRWEAPAGSALLCSVLLRPDARRRTSGTSRRSRSASPRSTRARTSRRCDVGLKWPNDLVVDDRKLGGILAEADGREDADGATAIVVGLGLNLSWPGPARGERDLARTQRRAVTVDARRAPRRATSPRSTRAIATLRTVRRALRAGRAVPPLARDARPARPRAAPRRRRRRASRRTSNDARPPRGRRPTRAARAFATGDVVHLRGVAEGSSRAPRVASRPCDSSSPAVPASSARTSSATGSSSTPTTSSSPTTRSPTRATGRTSTTSRTARPFVHGDIRDLDPAERTIKDHGIDTVVNFAAESHNSLAILDPARFFYDQRARDPDDARGRPPRGRRRGSTTSRRARSTATWTSTTPARSPRRARTGRGRPTTRRRPAATTPSARTSRPSSSPSRSRTAPTTTARTSSPRR